MIGLCILNSDYLDYAAIFYMKQLLAAKFVVWASGTDFLCFPGTPHSFGFFLEQCADRADFHALSAKHAFAFVIMQVTAGYYFAFSTTIAL
jgi:hypothetical protein